MENIAVVYFIIGFLLGLGAGGVLLMLTRKQHSAAMENLRETFTSLSYEALSRNTEEFMRIANEKLKSESEAGSQQIEGKKQQIDETVKTLRSDLEKVQNLMTSLEKDRHQKFGELSQELKRAAAETDKLQQTAQSLHSALANTKSRGQWGERMAEDVLRLAGFVENVNYQKQQSIEFGSTRSRPDYTFMLPQGQMVHMDVKFPMDNYLNYLNATNETEKTNYEKQFLADTRRRVKEATERGYVDTSKNTLDYILVFIPNEQVYAFIHERDSAILDEAMRQKVILCSPMTLYAILAVIRQAVDNFQLEKTAGEMLTLLGVFKKEWGNFVGQLEKVEKKFQETQNALTHLVTTRRNQVERPLKKIDDLRQLKTGDEQSLLEGADDNLDDEEDSKENKTA